MLLAGRVVAWEDSSSRRLVDEHVRDASGKYTLARWARSTWHQTALVCVWHGLCCRLASSWRKCGWCAGLLQQEGAGGVGGVWLMQLLSPTGWVAQIGQAMQLFRQPERPPPTSGRVHCQVAASLYFELACCPAVLLFCMPLHKSWCPCAVRVLSFHPS